MSRSLRFVRGGTAEPTGDALGPSADAGVLRCPGCRPMTGHFMGQVLELVSQRSKLVSVRIYTLSVRRGSWFGSLGEPNPVGERSPVANRGVIERLGFGRCRKQAESGSERPRGEPDRRGAIGLLTRICSGETVVDTSTGGPGCSMTGSLQFLLASLECGQAPTLEEDGMHDAASTAGDRRDPRDAGGHATARPKYASHQAPPSAQKEES